MTDVRRVEARAEEADEENLTSEGFNIMGVLHNFEKYVVEKLIMKRVLKKMIQIWSF